MHGVGPSGPAPHPELACVSRLSLSTGWVPPCVGLHRPCTVHDLVRWLMSHQRKGPSILSLWIELQPPNAWVQPSPTCSSASRCYWQYVSRFGFVQVTDQYQPQIIRNPPRLSRKWRAPQGAKAANPLHCHHSLPSHTSYSSVRHGCTSQDLEINGQKRSPAGWVQSCQNLRPPSVRCCQHTWHGPRSLHLRQWTRQLFRFWTLTTKGSPVPRLSFCMMRNKAKKGEYDATNVFRKLTGCLLLQRLLHHGNPTWQSDKCSTGISTRNLCVCTFPLESQQTKAFMQLQNNPWQQQRQHCNPHKHSIPSDLRTVAKLRSCGPHARDHQTDQTSWHSGAHGSTRLFAAACASWHSMWDLGLCF